MPEVRLVALDGLRFTVLVDRAQARTYVRANALLDSHQRQPVLRRSVHARDPDQSTPEEERALLSGPGVLYVREDPPLAGGADPATRAVARPGPLDLSAAISGTVEGQCTRPGGLLI